MITNRALKKVIVFDFGCHDFILSLANALSTRDYSILHLYSEDYLEGKTISNSSNQNKLFVSKGIRISRLPTNKNIFRRLFFELFFALDALQRIRKFKPDLIIIGTSPLLVSALVCHIFKSTPRIYWHQDSYSLGIAAELPIRSRYIKFCVSRLAFSLEKKCLVESNTIVSIGKNFSPLYASMNIDNTKIKYLENWATCEHPLESQKKTSLESNLGHKEPKLKLIYAGTLGLKHLPELIIDLYNKINEKSDCKLTILTSTDARIHLLNLVPPNSGIEILNFKEKGDFCRILSEFDFGITVLSEDASLYSIPSKMFTYAAHNLALVSLVPRDNPSAETTLLAGGILSDPTVEGVQKIADVLGELTVKDISDLKQKSHLFSIKSSAKQDKVEFFEGIIKSILK
jgi:colanic acid biosynthesis glycosyl transferase WcaI